MSKKSKNQNMAKTIRLILGRYDNMKTRCFNAKHEAYQYYGGRGIGICKSWLDYPTQFILWCLSNGFDKDLEIDRIDGNGDYSPSNCRFVTHNENVKKRKGTEAFKRVHNLPRNIYNNTKNTFCVRFKRNNIFKYFGTYKTLEEALAVKNIILKTQALENKNI